MAAMMATTRTSTVDDMKKDEFGYRIWVKRLGGQNRGVVVTQMDFADFLKGPCMDRSAEA